MEHATDTPEGQTHVDQLPSIALDNVFGRLGAKDLCSVTVTAKLWDQYTRARESDQLWKGLYLKRWPVKAGTADAGHWRSSFIAKKKTAQLMCCQERPIKKQLVQHEKDVKAVKLMPSHGLVVTGGRDQHVRIWDLDTSQTLSSSTTLGGMVCCLAHNDDVLLAGCSDGSVHCWQAWHNDPAFDVSAPSMTFAAHEQGITALSLSQGSLYSAGRDKMVKVWRHHEEAWVVADSIECDEVPLALVMKGTVTMVAAGNDALVYDAATLQVVHRLEDLHKDGVRCVEGNHSGNMMYTGGEDKQVVAHDLRMKSPSHHMWMYKRPVAALAWEDPWLASCATDGTVTVANTCAPLGRDAMDPSAHRTMQGHGKSACCVDIAEQYVASGSASGITRTWEFGAREPAPDNIKRSQARKRKVAEQRRGQPDRAKVGRVKRQSLHQRLFQELSLKKAAAAGAAAADAMSGNAGLSGSSSEDDGDPGAGPSNAGR